MTKANAVTLKELNVDFIGLFEGIGYVYKKGNVHYAYNGNGLNRIEFNG